MTSTICNNRIKLKPESLERRDLLTEVTAVIGADDSITLHCQNAADCELSGLNIINSDSEAALEIVPAREIGFEFALSDTNEQWTLGNLIQMKVMQVGDSITIGTYTGDAESLTVTYGDPREFTATPLPVLITQDADPHQLQPGDLQLTFDWPRGETYMSCQNVDGCYIRGVNFESEMGRLNFRPLALGRPSSGQSPFPLTLANNGHAAGSLGDTDLVFMDYGERWEMGSYQGMAGDLIAEVGGLDGNVILPIDYEVSAVDSSRMANAMRRWYGDFNEDARVDFEDFLILADNFGTQYEGVNIDFSFFLMFQLQFGQDSPRFTPFWSWVC